MVLASISKTIIGIGQASACLLKNVQTPVGRSMGGFRNLYGAVSESHAVNSHEGKWEQNKIFLSEGTDIKDSFHRNMSTVACKPLDYLSKVNPVRVGLIGRSHCQAKVDLQAAFTSSLLSPPQSKFIYGLHHTTSPFMEVTRNVIKFSMQKGRRKTQGALKTRFYRLDWGGWISAIPGRARHLWKKSAQQRHFLRNHVFRKATECKLLEKMATKYWVKKKYFVNDPYETYHTRDNFYITKGVKGIASTQLYKTKGYTIRTSQKQK